MSEHDDPSGRETVALRAPAAHDGAGLRPGTRIDNYRIRSLLGAGGMGQVYLADQLEPVQREVALKLLPEQVVDPMTRALFELERQSLAQMQHPAIARIYDAGTSDDGRAWIAMELVDGQPITTWCAENDLPLAQRLQLFQRVCMGVQHAHQKGVIHRDLKPDNVLVRELDGAPRPTIIDFGIAVASDTGASGHERAGTRAYMSPEQAAGNLRDLDTRSDVYALGVMLFELLVGDDAVRLTTQLYESNGDVYQTLLAASDQSAADKQPVDSGNEARKLFLTRARTLPAELRAILRKALSPERDDRYDSAAALAEDLGRYLERRPVMAMGSSSAYQARKFLSRHRWGLIAAVLVFAALATGLGFALHGMQRAQVQATRAQHVSQFVSAILTGVDPNVAEGEDTTLLRKVLDKAAKRAGTELAGQPEVRASIEHTMAAAYGALGLYDVAAQHNHKAVVAARQAGLPALEQAKLMAGMWAQRSEAGVSGEELLEGAEATEALLAKVPRDSVGRLRVEHDIALLLYRAGELEPALARLKTLLPRVRRLAPDGKLLSEALSMLAATYSDLGEHGKAERLYRELLQQHVLELGEMNTITLGEALNLSTVILRQDRFADAEKLLRHYLPLATKRLGPDHPQTMIFYANLGSAIRQQGNNEEARPYYRRTYEWARDRFGPGHLRTTLATANMAFLLRDIGELQEAETYARRAVEHVDKAMGEGNGYRGTVVDLLGTILFRQGDYPGAQVAFDRAWKIYNTSSGYGPDHPLAQETARRQVALYQAWHQPDKVALWQSRIATPADTVAGEEEK